MPVFPLSAFSNQREMFLSTGGVFHFGLFFNEFGLKPVLDIGNYRGIESKEIYHTMKICFISEDYYYNGGGERMLTSLCNALAAHHIITILSLLESHNKSNYALDGKVEIKRANVVPRSWGGFTKLSCLRHLYRQTGYLETFDVIITVGFVPGILLGVIRPFINRAVKLIAWEHNSYAMLSFIIRICEHLFYPGYDRLVILTAADLKNYRKLNKNVEVINNFIASMPDKISVIQENKQFLFVGRLEFVKGIEYLCEILKVYYTVCKGTWKVKIIGNGPYQAYIDDFLNRTVLHSLIELLSNTSAIEEEYKKSSCVIMTSRNEGLPMVLLEAASFGLPMISFDCATGPAEVINDGVNGYLIPRYDTNLFALKMVELEQDPDRLYLFSENAYRTAPRFLAGAVIPQWLRLIDSVKAE